MSFQFADVIPESLQQVLPLISRVRDNPSVDEMWLVGWMSDTPTMVAFPWTFNAT